MKRVYISGKIGEEVISDATRLKFAKAEEMLKAKGYEVFNPCDEKWQATLRRDYEKEKLSPGNLILEGKFPTFYAYALVYFLDDWEASSGANTELSFAMATGIRRLWQSATDAAVYSDDGEKTEDVWLQTAGKEAEP